MSDDNAMRRRQVCPESLWVLDQPTRTHSG